LPVTIRQISRTSVQVNRLFADKSKDDGVVEDRLASQPPSIHPTIPRNFNRVDQDELDFETRSSRLAVFDGGDHRDRPAFDPHFGRI
jgi:hypothetical protein